MNSSNYLNSLALSFDAKLEQLIDEVESYQNEENMWRTDENISNSAATLTIHLMGNLHHFIGASLGNTGYVRKRPEEFTARGVSRESLIIQLKECRSMVAEILTSWNADEHTADYPAEFSGSQDEDVKSLIHIFGHLAYHVGQINYHRRLLDN